MGPGLDVEVARAAFDGWVASYGVTSPAALRLAAQGAAATLRLDQLDRIQERVAAEVLEGAAGESAPAVALALAREVRATVAGLASLAGDIHGPVDRSHAAKLLPALRVVLQGVLGLDGAGGGSAALSVSIGLIENDEIYEIPAEVFATIATSCGEIVAAIDAAIPGMETKVEAERARQEDLLVLANDKRLREVDRVRGRLIKEIEALARALAAVRDLEHCPGGESRAVPTDLPPVEFRVVSSPRRL